MKDSEQEEMDRLQSFASFGSKVFIFFGLALLALKALPAIARFVIQLTSGVEKQIERKAKTLGLDNDQEEDAVLPQNSSRPAPDGNQKNS